MSGICAIINFDGAPVDPEVLVKMTEAAAYRGPDGITYAVAGSVGLAYLALHSTPESLRESQPLHSPDGQISLVADVRIDNRPELIALLTAKGFLYMADPTDPDLVLAAYRCWGPACPEHILGDYAIAIWDAPQQRLLCARDAFGVKSLHYSRVGSTLCVASEAQQILKHPQVPCELDEVAAADYLAGNNPLDGHSMFVGVWAVPAANRLIASSSGLLVERYWDIDPEARTIYKGDDEYAAHFLELFKRCVTDHLRTQAGTIGITMSGGLDSTSIAAVAQKYLTAMPGSPHLLACSHTFETLKNCDERQYSQVMADELGIEIIYLQAEQYWLLDNDEAYTPQLETPFMTDETRDQAVMSILKNSGARVWLTGHGGDNMLTGNPLYYANRVQWGDLSAVVEIFTYFRSQHISISNLVKYYRRWIIKPLIPQKVLSLFQRSKNPKIPAYFNEEFVRRTGISQRLESSPFPHRFPDRSRQENYTHMVYTNEIQKTINWAERQAARYHMEARHPFLDRRLAEFLVSIPPDQIYRVGRIKFIMRNAMQGILPDVVRTRLRKTEFSSYLEIGLRYKETFKIKNLLNNTLLFRHNLVKLIELHDLYAAYLSRGRVSDGIKLWWLISLELWLRNLYSTQKGEKNDAFK